MIDMREARILATLLLVGLLTMPASHVVGAFLYAGLGMPHAANQWLGLFWRMAPQWILFALLGGLIGALSQHRWLIRVASLMIAAVATAWLFRLAMTIAPGFWTPQLISQMAFVDVMGAALALQAGWIGHRFGVRRRPPTFGPAQCQACGYSLRGLTSSVCPECGGAIPWPEDARRNTVSTAPKP